MVVGLWWCVCASTFSIKSTDLILLNAKLVTTNYHQNVRSVARGIQFHGRAPEGVRKRRIRTKPERRSCSVKCVDIDKPWDDVYFVYLMINTFERTKTHTYVGKDRKPRRKVMLHNSGHVKNARSTRPAMGHWRLMMTIGPVGSRSRAKELRDEWRAHSRGIEPRSERGREIARKYGLVCWDVTLDIAYHTHG